MANNPVAPFRHFFQINKYGEPIPGTNVAIKNSPRTFGAGQRWTEYITAAQICCLSSNGVNGVTSINSINSKWRYYVRLKEDTLVPISGTLQRYKQPPSNGRYGWQEVVPILGGAQCSALAHINVTTTWTDNDPQIIDLSVISSYFVAVPSTGATDQGHMTYVFTGGGPGTLTITQNNPLVSNTDTVTLQFTNGSCIFAFQITLAFVAS